MGYCIAALQNPQKPGQLGKVLLQPLLDKPLEEEVEVVHPATYLFPPLLIIIANGHLSFSHVGQILISKYNQLS